MHGVALVMALSLACEICIMNQTRVSMNCIMIRGALRTDIQFVIHDLLCSSRTRTSLYGQYPY